MPNENQSRTVATLRWITLAALGMTTLLALLPAVGHDQLWCLYVGQRMLAGAKLYGPQILESNPPLIMWFSEALAAISGALSVPITVLFKISVTGIGVISGLLALRTLRSMRRFSQPVLWALAFAFLVIFGAIAARDFGQRDHLLAVLCLPYVAAAALDVYLSLEVTNNTRHPDSELVEGEGARYFARPGTALRVLTGIAAGAGLCLKPHHALVPLAIETILLIKTKSLRTLIRPELLAMLATGAAAIVAVRRFTPEYLTEIVPLLRDVYWAIGHLTPVGLVTESLQLHILALTVLALGLKKGWKTADPVVTMLAAAGIASTIAYYLQGTGWYYQQLPAISFFALALTFQLVDLCEGRALAIPAWLPKAAAALTILALGLTTHFMGYPFTADRSFPIDLPDASFFRGLAPGTPVAILTTAVDDAVPPMMKYHLLMAQRTNNLWILPAILRNESPAGQPPLKVLPPARLAELDREQHRWMVEDLNRWQPKLILVERCQAAEVHCQVLEDRHDDFLAWFGRDPAFRVAFGRYHLLRSVGPYDAYVPN